METIVAVASPPGRGAVGIVRLSGPEAFKIAREICKADLPSPRYATLRSFHDEQGQRLDRGLVVVFPRPRSYTGEDVVELQGHGGSVVMDLLLRAACAFGARLARPGEFSERAFLNDRIDLIQAEAVSDLIDAASRAAVLAANRSLEGELSRRVGSLADSLLDLRVFVEGALDFSDEDVNWLSDADLMRKLMAARRFLDDLIAAAAQGRRLREGLTVAIAGRPNVGKSTLLNRLAGTDAAIVSDRPGTTRDVLREQLTIGGLPITVVDTAGLREAGDPIEREGVRRAWQTVEQVDVTLFVAEDKRGITSADRVLLDRIPTGVRRILVFNKCDLSRQKAATGKLDNLPFVRMSAASGEGIELLQAALTDAAGLGEQTEGLFSARRRHLDALTRTRSHLDAATRHIKSQSSAELAAEELRRAHYCLGEITGRVTSEDLLGAVFARFCIGK